MAMRRQHPITNESRAEPSRANVADVWKERRVAAQKENGAGREQRTGSGIDAETETDLTDVWS